MIDWTATSQGGGIWLFEWTAVVDREYEIWLNGTLLGTVTPTTTTGQYTSTIEGYVSSPPPLEIHDTTSSSKAENEEFPPFAVIQWRGLTTAAAYTVERLNGTWAIIKTVTETGVGFYAYNTQLLTDYTETQYRVTALNTKGTSGQALTFDVTVVRNPAPPAAALVVSGGDLIWDEP
jgi:hypothetical protein